jgi:hypothetical protein
MYALLLLTYVLWGGSNGNSVPVTTTTVGTFLTKDDCDKGVASFNTASDLRYIHNPDGGLRAVLLCVAAGTRQ